MSTPIVTSQQQWTYTLPVQQQSVLMLGCRGADGVEKYHDSKELVRIVRSLVMNAAVFGRPLKIDVPPMEADHPEIGGEFMHNDILNTSIYLYKNADRFSRQFETKTLFGHSFCLPEVWTKAISRFMSVIDCLSYHYVNHFRQTCEIIAYKHPNENVRYHFLFLYLKLVDNMHCFPETMDVMDKRLSDWDHKYWD